MISSSINIRDDFGELGVMIDQDAMAGLNAAAAAAHPVAEQHSTGTGTSWEIRPARPTYNGFVSGLRATTPTWRVFNKGSLGKRTAALKQPGRRKDYWTVKRGANPFTAHRGDTTGKGVAAKNISNPTRTAGRHALIARAGHLIR